MQSKSAARVSALLKGARMFTRFRDTDFVRRSHCVNGVLRTVLKGCKNSPKRTEYNQDSENDKDKVKYSEHKKKTQNKT